jgi:hypothetical protein
MFAHPISRKYVEDLLEGSGYDPTLVDIDIMHDHCGVLVTSDPSVAILLSIKLGS